jgi:hypothetical protein
MTEPVAVHSGLTLRAKYHNPGCPSGTTSYNFYHTKACFTHITTVTHDGHRCHNAHTCDNKHRDRTLPTLFACFNLCAAVDWVYSSSPPPFFAFFLFTRPKRWPAMADRKEKSMWPSDSVRTKNDGAFTIWRPTRMWP